MRATKYSDGWYVQSLCKCCRGSGIIQKRADITQVPPQFRTQEYLKRKIRLIRCLVRRYQIYAMRTKENMTFKDIGSVYGISAKMARDIFNKAERIIVTDRQIEYNRHMRLIKGIPTATDMELHK